MSALSNQLRLFGLIEEMHREAADLGLSRTAAALKVTAAVAMEELSDAAPAGVNLPKIDRDEDEDQPA
jgi:hypothetical protein